MKSGSWNLNFYQHDDFMVHVMSLNQWVLINAHILSKAWGGLKHYCTWSPLDMRRIPWLKQPLRQEIRHRDGVSVGMCLWLRFSASGSFEIDVTLIMSHRIHVWIFYPHFWWNMATFKGKWLGKYSLHGGSIWGDLITTYLICMMWRVEKRQKSIQRCSVEKSPAMKKNVFLQSTNIN